MAALVALVMAPSLSLQSSVMPTPAVKPRMRMPAVTMKDPTMEVVESVAGLLPIALPAATLAWFVVDNGGITDGTWDGTAVRINDAPKREYYGSSDFDKWLNSNVGGGSTDFEYTGYKREGYSLPELSLPSSPDELLENPLTVVFALLFLTELALAQQAGVTSPTGLLGFASGQFIKFLFDVWNAIAPSIGLGGAILKY